MGIGFNKLTIPIAGKNVQQQALSLTAGEMKKGTATLEGSFGSFLQSQT